ncbi:ornithine aminotransferase [Flavobacterium noncentrifugens]|uniref:Osmotically-inducible protein OsmY, contains BON domain n=1 Tax=Flavobacterium noncentrifugens TaxID=1128970 RepID=A0A1G8WYI1_9FLAO|nr:BON domain-containing protein [Flavobacterium noncentrifugens]GEP51091.1 ornithine aminotransferase [Flavobacterium noncentrifugens]SDJ83117.1 Osmotically-inducible protein OsmY, contains BON domain [Flavobacterium noncentrifugens]
MKTDQILQQEVHDAIRWEPLLQNDQINVAVKDGIVTLKGTVTDYYKKSAAENAARDVAGVTAVLEHIDVRGLKTAPSDDEIATAAIELLQRSWSMPVDRVKIKVENGWLTLEGEIPCLYQKMDAKALVSYLPGVKGITNAIKVTSEMNDGIEQKEVMAALQRNSEVNTKDITVKVTGTGVRLSGYVASLYQKQEAERIASKTKGISSVSNRLIVIHAIS